MSEANTTLNTSNQLNTDYDFSKIFIGNNDFRNGTLVNPEAGEETIVAGTLLGRVTAGGNVQVLKSAAVDGSQIPIGILAETITLAAAATAEVSFCIGGDVAQEKLILNGGDTLATDIDGRQLGDRIEADTLGIYLVAGDELTEFDNQ